MSDIKMRVSGIEKSFPGVKALSNIDFLSERERFMHFAEKMVQGNLH